MAGDPNEPLDFDQPVADTAGIVLATADRFNAWLNGAASTESSP
jgi:hypothetical protein